MSAIKFMGKAPRIFASNANRKSSPEEEKQKDFIWSDSKCATTLKARELLASSAASLALLTTQEIQDAQLPHMDESGFLLIKQERKRFPATVSEVQVSLSAVTLMTAEEVRTLPSARFKSDLTPSMELCCFDSDLCQVEPEVVALARQFPDNMKRIPESELAQWLTKHRSVICDLCGFQQLPRSKVVTKLSAFYAADRDQDHQFCELCVHQRLFLVRSMVLHNTPYVQLCDDRPLPISCSLCNAEDDCHGCECNKCSLGFCQECFDPQASCKKPSAKAQPAQPPQPVHPRCTDLALTTAAFVNPRSFTNTTLVFEIDLDGDWQPLNPAELQQTGHSGSEMRTTPFVQLSVKDTLRLKQFHQFVAEADRAKTLKPIQLQYFGDVQLLVNCHTIRENGTQLYQRTPEGAAKAIDGVEFFNDVAMLIDCMLRDGVRQVVVSVMTCQPTKELLAPLHKLLQTGRVFVFSSKLSLDITQSYDVRKHAAIECERYRSAFTAMCGALTDPTVSVLAPSFRLHTATGEVPLLEPQGQSMVISPQLATLVTDMMQDQRLPRNLLFAGNDQLYSRILTEQGVRQAADLLQFKQEATELESEVKRRHQEMADMMHQMQQQMQQVQITSSTLSSPVSSRASSPLSMMSLASPPSADTVSVQINVDEAIMCVAEHQLLPILGNGEGWWTIESEDALRRVLSVKSLSWLRLRAAHLVGCDELVEVSMYCTHCNRLMHAAYKCSDAACCCQHQKAKDTIHLIKPAIQVSSYLQQALE